MASGKRPGRRGGGRGAGAKDPVAVGDDPISAKVASKLEANARKVEQIAGKLEAHARRHEEIVEQLDRKAAALQRVGEGLRAFDIWTRPGATTRRPRFNRDDITVAAIRLADADGFDAVSMRRLATELGVGTMTLYHYVRTKDELLALVVDALMGEVLVPDGVLPDSWKDAITLIAIRTADMARRHPWILDISDDPPFGPNSVRHIDESLAALATAPGSFSDRMELIAAVDDLAFGMVRGERDHAGGDHADERREMVDYLEGLVATGDYPELARLQAEHGIEESMELIDGVMRDPERLDRCVARLLDGYELEMADGPA